MRRFLSRSRSAPLPSQWDSSEKLSSPSPIDCPPRYSGQERSMASEAFNAQSTASVSLTLPSIPPKGQMSGTTDSSYPIPSHTLKDPDSETKVSQCNSAVDRELPPRPPTCFAVVRLPSNAGYDGCKSASRIVIHDPSLQAVYRDIVQVLTESSGAVQPLEVPLDLLLACVPRFKQYLDTLRESALHPEQDHARKAVDALTSYLQKEHDRTLAEITDLTSKGEITFDALLAIFLPDTIVVAKCADTGERCAYELKSATKVRTPSADVYDLVCESLDSDVAADATHCAWCLNVRRSASASPTCTTGAHYVHGGNSSGWTRLRRVQRRMLVPHFKGAVQIRSLNIYPLKYHPDAGRLEASLIERGRRWISLQGIRHVEYAGPAVCTVSVGGCKTSVKYDVNSFVLLDRGSFVRLNPDCQTTLENVGDSGGLPELSSKPEALILAPPVLYGFSILDQRWLVFNVEYVQPVEAHVNPLHIVEYDTDIDGSVRNVVYEGSPADNTALAKGVGRRNEQRPIDVKAAMTAANARPVDEGDSDSGALAAVVQRFCKEELSAFTAGFEEECMHVFAELNAKYAAERAIDRQTMRTILIVAGLIVFRALMLLLYRLSAPTARTSRWSGPIHFTIPILSPFSSVVEHESSSFGLRQVVVLSLVAGSFFVFWLRCCVRRK